MARSSNKTAIAGANTPAAPPGSMEATRPARARKSVHVGQEARLIDSMVELCAAGGYLNVSVADLSARAGVSSKTFYELFEDKEDCLLAAYRASASRVLASVGPLPAQGGWAAMARGMIEQMLAALQAQPAAGRLLLVEVFAGGERVRRARAEVLVAFERRAQTLIDEASRDGKLLDLPVEAFVGALRSIAYRRLRTHSEDLLPEVVEDLLSWLDSYARPLGAARWSTGEGSLLAVDAVTVKEPMQERAAMTRRLPRGRHRLPPGAVARSQRTRIVRGTASVMQLSGYAEATVSEIVAAAGISREIFYEHFANKHHAFLGAQQYATQHALDVCASAYFSGERWPERVWRALAAFVSLLAGNPALAHLRLVECYAAGPAATENAEEVKRATTLLTQEAFAGAAGEQPPPRLYAEAISGALFEAFYRRISRGDFVGLQRSLPRLAYVVVAPFLGAEEAVAQLRRMN